MAITRISPDCAHAPEFASLSDYLDDVGWFRVLDKAEQRSLKSGMHERTIGKSQHLVHHGERPTTGYFVLSGQLTWADTSAEGKTVAFANLTAGALFGFGTLFNRQPRAGNVVAMSTSRVGCMPASVFNHLVNTSIPFNHALIHDFSERLQWFRGNLMAAGAAATDLQVVRAIVGNFHPALNPVLQSALRLTQEQVANLSGVSRQRCNRTLKRLKAWNLINTSYGEITVLDLERMRLLTRDNSLCNTE